jgi:hypothetical protein
LRAEGVYDGEGAAGGADVVDADDLGPIEDVPEGGGGEGFTRRGDAGART